MPTSPPPDNEVVAPVGDTSIPGAPPLDIEQYRKHLDGLDLSEAQATELLETLWSILSAFVDQAFGVDSVLLARPQHQDGTAETDAAAEKTLSAQ
ncbi:MAG: hypothetical protein WA970_03540 [Gammaproteobacteria bacterium]